MIDPIRKEQIRSVFAGTLASMLATIVSQPLQVIKVNIQLTVKDKLNRKLFLITIRKIFEKDGIRGFWRCHISSQILGILTGVTLFLVFHENVRILNKTYLKDHKQTINYISGFVAGTCASALYSPIDLINTRKMYQKSADNYTNFYKGVKYIIKQNGFLSLYRGITVNWIHFSNVIGLKFLLYYKLVNFIGHNEKCIYNQDFKIYSLFFCGALAGLSASIITFPCEVIKRHLHISTLRKRKCDNIRSCIKFIFVKEGLKGFYKGISPAIMKSCLVSAICFSAFDVIAPLLDYLI